jgi:hypothetical protein
MTGSKRVMTPNFLSENEIALRIKFIWMIRTSFAIMGLLFHKVSVIFNTLLPMLGKMLYINVAKFPARTSEHIVSDTSEL